MNKGTYQVWHLNDEKLSRLPVITEASFPEDYCLVAKVKASSLEEVFNRTNSTSQPWWKNPDVECVKPSRSTMVFDVVIDPRGDVYVVEQGGWMLAWSHDRERERGMDLSL